MVLGYIGDKSKCFIWALYKYKNGINCNIFSEIFYLYSDEAKIQQKKSYLQNKDHFLGGCYNPTLHLVFSYINHNNDQSDHNIRERFQIKELIFWGPMSEHGPGWQYGTHAQLLDMHSSCCTTRAQWSKSKNKLGQNS